jgi:hypothetical protein
LAADFTAGLAEEALVTGLVTGLAGVLETGFATGLAEAFTTGLATALLADLATGLAVFLAVMSILRQQKWGHAEKYA